MKRSTVKHWSELQKSIEEREKELYKLGRVVGRMVVKVMKGESTDQLTKLVGTHRLWTNIKDSAWDRPRGFACV